MMFPEPKYVIFSEILLHPTFGTKISGLPYFYSVKLDVIGFGQKAHFWNWETSYIKVLYMIFHELDDVHLRFFKMTRATSSNELVDLIPHYEITGHYEHTFPGERPRRLPDQVHPERQPASRVEESLQEILEPAAERRGQRRGDKARPLLRQHRPSGGGLQAAPLLRQSVWREEPQQGFA